MIVWLASYPRSGNTFLRVLLSRYFNAKTYSIYDDESDIGRSATLTARTGHTPMGSVDFLRAAERSKRHFFIKTHGLPEDDHPAIYIVRDGRAATAAFWEFRRELRGVHEPLHSVAIGENWVGPWARHVERWLSRPADRTLVIRFEDLTSRPDEAARSIAAFLNRRPGKARLPAFQDLRKEDPDFFRVGDNAARIQLLARHCPTLFMAVNGRGMVTAGYLKEHPQLNYNLLSSEIVQYKDWHLASAISGQIQTDP